MASFDVPETSFTKEFYEDNNSAQMQIFTEHMSNLLMLVGEEEQSAAEGARLYFEFEKTLANAAMNREDYSDVSKAYNLFTMDELKSMFSGFDLDMVYSASHLEPTDRIVVTDVGLTRALAEYINDENLGSLKAYMKIQLLLRYGNTVSRDFETVSKNFRKSCLVPIPPSRMRNCIPCSCRARCPNI